MRSSAITVNHEPRLVVRGGRSVGVFYLAAVVSVLSAAAPRPGFANAHCTADCNSDGRVAVNELIRSVNINLGIANLSTCLRADRDGSGTVTIEELVAAVGRGLDGCSRLEFKVDVHNPAAATVTLKGSRVAGPGANPGERVSYEHVISAVNANCNGYPQESCTCPGGGDTPCAFMLDLAPGEWKHEICVDPGGGNCSDLNHQYQVRRAIVTADGSSAQRLDWTTFRTVHNVLNVSASGGGSLRAALDAAAVAPGPALVQFRRDNFPANQDRVIVISSGAALSLRGNDMVVDGTDSEGHPSPLQPWSARTFRRVIELDGAGAAPVTFGFGTNAPVVGARLIGLSVRRTNLGSGSNQEVVVITGGPGSVRNEVMTSLLDGGAGQLISGVSNRDCLLARDTAQEEETNTVRDSEIRHCADRGVKVNRARLRLERNWIHHNLMGGVTVENGLGSEQPGAGKVASVDNLIEANGRNASDQIVDSAARGIVAANGAVPSRPIEIHVDGDIIRRSVHSGISIQDYTSTLVENTTVCGTTGGVGGSDGQGFAATVANTNQPFFVRGSTFAYNNRNGVFVAGADVGKISFGKNPVPERGHNAFTRNNTAGLTQPRNFRNNGSQTVEARHNQWQRCGNLNICGDISADYSGPVAVDPPQPHRTSDVGTYPYETLAVDRAIPGTGQTVRLRGSGFNAIDGYPASGNCTTTPAANNVCASVPEGTCVEASTDPQQWAGIGTVQAVTPLMVAFSWPSSLAENCLSKPLQIRSRRRGPQGGQNVMFSKGTTHICNAAAMIPQ